MRISLKHLVAACALVVTKTLGAQQAPTAAPVGPQVGEMAPDFALAGATRIGPSQTPIRLSDLRGQTVVIAFFPKARTGG
jgi:peroxiredoxin Q/BCP